MARPKAGGATHSKLALALKVFSQAQQELAVCRKEIAPNKHDQHKALSCSRTESSASGKWIICTSARESPALLRAASMIEQMISSLTVHRWWDWAGLRGCLEASWPVCVDTAEIELSRSDWGVCYSWKTTDNDVMMKAWRLGDALQRLGAVLAYIIWVTEQSVVRHKYDVSVWREEKWWGQFTWKLAKKEWAQPSLEYQSVVVPGGEAMLMNEKKSKELLKWRVVLCFWCFHAAVKALQWWWWIWSISEFTALWKTV